MVAVLAVWAGVVLTEVVAPRLTTFAVLGGLASAGPLVATGLWARTGSIRAPGEKRDRREEREPPARRGLERDRRILGTLWVSTLPAAIVAALLARWLCPEALPVSMAGLLVVPAAVYTFVIPPDTST